MQKTSGIEKFREALEYFLQQDGQWIIEQIKDAIVDPRHYDGRLLGILIARALPAPQAVEITDHKRITIIFKQGEQVIDITPPSATPAVLPTVSGWLENFGALPPFKLEEQPDERA